MGSSAEDDEDALLVSGRAVMVGDPGRREVATAQFLVERGLEAAPAEFEAQELLEFRLDRCLWTAITRHGDWHPRQAIGRAT
jgi:hypothetical protein